MNIETGIVDHLLSFPAIRSMVGNDIDMQLTPEDAVLPYINFSRISSSQVQSMAGPARLGESRFQINCWAANYTDALQLAEYVRRVLDGHDADLGDITVQIVTMIDQGDLPTELSEGSSKVTAYGIRQDYEIFWENDV